MNAPLSSSTCNPGLWHEIHPALGISMLDHLFNKLDGIYANRWKQQFSCEQAVKNWRDAWAEAFCEEGITTVMVSIALRRCRKEFDWPPSLTEFLRVCKPELDVDAALREAIEQTEARQHGTDEWSNPTIFWAATKVGQFDLLSLPHSALRSRFAAALAKVIEGGEIAPVPPRAPSLAAPGKSESTREHGRQQLDSLTGSLDLMRTGAQGGNRNWARRIIADHERGVAVPASKLSLARAAIGQP